MLESEDETVESSDEERMSLELRGMKSGHGAARVASLLAKTRECVWSGIFGDGRAI